MKKAVILTGILLIIISMLLFSGCSENLDELREQNDDLNEVIEDMTDELNNLTDKAASLVIEAEDNWNLLQECIAERQEENKESVIITAAEDPVVSGEWTLIESTEYDITGDGNQETISLFTTAVKDEAGNMMWDDGQFFLATVKESGKTFTLFNEYVQIGRVYFTVFTGEDAGVIVTISTYAGIKLDKFIYIKKDDSFIGNTMYSTGDINVIHSTMPWD